MWFWAGRLPKFCPLPICQPGKGIPWVCVHELQTSRTWVWPQRKLQAQTSEQGEVTHRRPPGWGWVGTSG